MKPEFFCCIGGELKDTIQGIFKCSRIFLYRAAQSQTIDDMLVDGFFNEADDIRVNDLIILYCPEESRSYTFAKVSSIVNGVVKTKELDIPNLADFADVAFSGLLSDLLDVTITNPQVGDCLQWNGSKWVNLSGGGGSATWGAVGGDITDQLDLQSALGNKANVDLNNLSLTGEARFTNKANVDLDNLSATGQGKFDAKQDLIGGGTSGTLITNTGTPGTVSETTIDSTVASGSNNPVSSDAVYNAIQAMGANKDLSNLTDTGANIANWSHNVTNCITEIPQDIKLELNNGTLTLKAGSKLYVPNGVGVYNEITVAADVILDSSLTSTYGNGNYLWCYNPTLNKIQGGNNVYNQCQSGTYDGTQYCMFYDTTNNVIKYTTDSGSTWESGYSLPFTLTTLKNGVGNTSIDQVFNGFGYIGSTVFVLPGIKYLVPDGLNDDGTYKNIESTISDVLTLTMTVSGWAGMWNIYCHGTYISAHPTVLEIISNSPPTVNTATAYWYNPQTNFMYWTSDSGVTWTKTTVFSIGKLIENSTRITNLNGKPTFHAVDFSTFGQIVSFRLPYSDNSRSWFVKWSNGIVIQGQQISNQNTTTTFPVPMANTDYFLGGVGFTIANIGSQTILSRTTTGFTTGSNVQNSSTLGYWVFGKYA